MKNILFLSFIRYNTLKVNDIYAGILRNFIRNGDRVCVVSLEEKKHGIDTFVQQEDCSILHVKIGDYFNVDPIRKGLTTVQLERRVLDAIKRYFPDVRFDLVLYATPPVSFAGVIRCIKKRDNARTYLMLKDIFPQNAVDLGMMSKTGLKGLIYRYFRRQEKQLYAISDRIGCMSQANCDYVIKHNPEVDPEKVELCPNCIEVQDLAVSEQQHLSLRKKYGLPPDKKIFVYGGNLGKPQDIPFIIDCLKSQRKNQNAFFLVVGNGTEYGRLQAWFDQEKPGNMKLMKRLPKDEYDGMIAACDVGLIFLDHRFTIPNFPSRLLAYMQAGLPVLACTDPNTDIGKVIADGGFGWWCPSNDPEAFSALVHSALSTDLTQMKLAAKQHLQAHYTADRAYGIINDAFK